MFTPSKELFEVINGNLEVIISLSKNAEDFSFLWRSYLESSGWSEEEFEEYADKAISNINNIN